MGGGHTAPCPPRGQVHGGFRFQETKRLPGTGGCPSIHPQDGAAGSRCASNGRKGEDRGTGMGKSAEAQLPGCGRCWGWYPLAKTQPGMVAPMTLLQPPFGAHLCPPPTARATPASLPSSRQVPLGQELGLEFFFSPPRPSQNLKQKGCSEKAFGWNSHGFGLEKIWCKARKWLSWGD